MSLFVSKSCFKDEYKDVLIDTLQYSEFLKKYVKDNYDEVFEDYFKTESPRVLSVIKVAMKDVEKPTSEESKKKSEVEKLLKTSKSFGEIAHGNLDFGSAGRF